jgi:16S rRNA (cytidine1402-2'-O)-methyltransferase
MAFLYIVATPIGNLDDISLRALQILKSVDAILCEDTRVTAKLLAHFDIKKRLFAYHQHSDAAKTEDIARTLREGMSLALVSDAGTPGINDPGGRLIQELLLGVPDLQIVPIPGANAAVAALSVSGFPADRYQYWGFVPHKKGRQTFFRDLATTEDTVVFYESKHRITKALASLAETDPERKLMVARELTKKFETFYRGTPAEIAPKLTGDDTLGEFVVVVAPKNWK